jgi:hypothetical protein
VRGAAIFGVNGTVICWYVRDGIDITQYLDFVSVNIQENIPSSHPGMFNESIVDFNGHKILLLCIKPTLILLLVVDRKAYLGLLMLDVECFLRDMVSTSVPFSISYEALY